jgi:hypothetical protein
MIVDAVQKTDDLGTPSGTVVSYSDPKAGARIGAPPGGDENQVPAAGCTTHQIRNRSTAIRRYGPSRCPATPNGGP